MHDFLSMVRPLRLKDGATVVARWRYEDEQRKNGLPTEAEVRREARTQESKSSAEQLQALMDRVQAKQDNDEF